MVSKSVIPDSETKMVLQRIEEARADRSFFEAVYNSYIDRTRPSRQRVKNCPDASSPRPPAEQDDLFDMTLAGAADDFASDFNDEYTPSYKPWTKHKASQDFAGAGARKQVEEYVKTRMARTYDRIRESNFEEASQELYYELSFAPSALMIAYSPPGKPFRVNHVPIHELLIRPGPYGGVDDRWWERMVMVRHLDTLWPDVDWSDYGQTLQLRKESKASALVAVGGFQDWTGNEEKWFWHVVSNKKVLRRKEYVGRGSCPLIVARTHVSSPTAYGLGVGLKALPASRTLDEMNYLGLKFHGRTLDPPVIFSDAGTLNPEGGIENGAWLQADEGFKIHELRPEGSARESWFKEEQLRMDIKRPLFQDGPEQRGDTPPTLGQWLSEEARSARRKSFPRARLQAELVLPSLWRFDWMMQKRGEIEPIKVDGNLVTVEPISPMSRSADIEEAQIAVQFLQGIGGVLPNEMGRIDGTKTLNDIRSRMGADLVSILSDEEFQAKMQQQAELQQQPQQGV